ncbi:MAG: hypothetical protein IMF19_07350 [Proteobacteria bacterium]|nr:hypothetical protein [Pseudomonadota bacterium]
MTEIETIDLKMWKEQDRIIGEAVLTDPNGQTIKHYIDATTALILLAVLQVGMSYKEDRNDTH